MLKYSSSVDIVFLYNYTKIDFILIKLFLKKSINSPFKEHKRFKYLLNE
jgi:hypothetical protein